jgi:hypothetical protein
MSISVSIIKIKAYFVKLKKIFFTKFSNGVFYELTGIIHRREVQVDGF